MPPELRLAEPTKRCAGCRQVKPWSAYWAKVKWPDGTTRQPHSRCKECLNRAKRERTAADPEWVERERARNRGWRRRKAKVDPAYREHENRRVRERRAALRGDRGGHLPIAPFREWLQAQLTKPDATTGGLAARLDTKERTLYRWLTDGQVVQLDTVDAALCAFGDPFLLAELYPQLYSEQAA